MIYYQQASRDVQKGDIKPFYLLFGEEQLLAEKLIHKIKSVFLSEVEPELNYFVRYATEGTSDEIINLSSGMGLFSQRKLLVLKEADALKQKELERISKLFEQPQNDIRLVMQTGIASLYQSRLKKIEDSVTVVNLLPLKPEELKNFVSDEFQKSGKQINPEAVELLIFMVGFQLSDLLLQISHVCDYFAENQSIDVKQIEQVVGIYATQDIFELSRLIGHKDYRKASVVLANLIGSGISSQYILSQLIRHFTALWRIQGYLRAGISRTDALANKLRIYYKYVDEYKEQARHWKTSGLMQVFQFIKEADRELKNSTLEPQIILDMLNYRIINLK
jgi:DNA polymerase-3 subunit delta